MFYWMKKIFGTAQSRLLKRYRKMVDLVNRWEERMQKLSDEELRAKTQQFRDRLQHGEDLDSLLPEAYAVVKNVCRRLMGKEVHVSGYTQKWDMIPYDVQILGAIAMHQGAIAEMQTGEGKTLTAAMPLYLNALTGKPVHLVTVNDYLATRDCEWIGAIFRWLGLTTAALTGNTSHRDRKATYAADIVYGTASEFGFDYLRDNSMAQSSEEQCQRGHYFAIVDEIDSILIDEARTPLIISGPSGTSYHMYEELKKDVTDLVRVQRDLCNRIANDARKILEKNERLNETAEIRSSYTEEEREAFRKLWLVKKGLPNHKVLRRILEHPDLRAQIEKWDTYFYSEQNKEERADLLSELFVIVEEKANDFELTDKGILQWQEHKQGNFTMLDLGEEYANIDREEGLSDQEKMEKKIALREEDSLRKERVHNVRQLLRAHLMMERDVDYIVDADKIVIIDENTGRPQPGRRFSDGLHQAIEAKEGVTIQGETQTYATITLQNYFRMYTKLAGMTGTAMTEAQEFKEIYKLEVVAIPTHRPSQRVDFDDEIYMTEREKMNAILKEVQEIHSKGRPILIGTESVEASEKLSRILRQNHLSHTVLNAKHHEKEAEVIAQAGNRSAITVSTNMAGRGTDIKLAPGIAEIGGLHVLGTTRHRSRRIDRQLRGRSARQGDPGSSKFFISFEDDLLRQFASPKITYFLQRFRPPEGEAISAKILNRSIETAQKRIEQKYYSIRKHTLEYDDVMNKQREEIYAFRNEVLHIEDPIQLVKNLLRVLSFEAIPRYVQGHLDMHGLRSWLTEHFPISFDIDKLDHLNPKEIVQHISDEILHSFERKLSLEEAKVKNAFDHSDGKAHRILCNVIRSILIRNIDKMWQEHLLRIDHLRTEVMLRTVGQKDPLLEFKHEAFALFSAFTLHVKEDIARALFKFEVIMPTLPHRSLV